MEPATLQPVVRIAETLEWQNLGDAYRQLAGRGPIREPGKRVGVRLHLHGLRSDLPRPAATQWARK